MSILRNLRLSFWFSRAAETFNAFPKFLALLWRHLLPSLLHPAPPMLAPAAMAMMESAKKNLAQDHESQGLPERDQPQSKNGRHQPVPQPHHDKAEEYQSYNSNDRNSYSSCYPIPQHFYSSQFLKLGVNGLEPPA